MGPLLGVMRRAFYTAIAENNGSMNLRRARALLAAFEACSNHKSMSSKAIFNNVYTCYRAPAKKLLMQDKEEEEKARARALRCWSCAFGTTTATFPIVIEQLILWRINGRPIMK